MSAEKFLNADRVYELWAKIKTGLTGKQDRLRGQPGQLAGFNQAGALSPQYLNFQVLGDGNPVGAVISFLGVTAPQGYLVCDGSQYAVEDYPELAGFFESQFGAKNHFGGDGETTFAVPDMQSPQQESGASDTLFCIKVKENPGFSTGDYSLEEQRIGTWIDGKPLYRKVYVYTILSTEATNTLLVPLDLTIIQPCIFETYVYNVIEKQYLNTNAYFDSYYRANIHIGSTGIQQSTGSAFFGAKCTSILCYTKTTD